VAEEDDEVQNDVAAPPAEVAALFVADGDRFVPTLLTQGPWSRDHQFGGAPSALVAHVADRAPSLVPMQVARLTVDLLRPVPIAPLSTQVRVRREGRRIQVLEVTLHADEVEVVRASALRMRVTDLSHLDLPTGPAMSGPPAVPLRPYEGPRRTERPLGMERALEYAYEHPGRMFAEPTWLRLAVPVVHGSVMSGLERMAYVADAVSGIGHPMGAPLTGINADISMSVVRYAVGEWLCVIGSGWVGPEGIGVAHATLADEAGVVASVGVSRLVDETPEPP
jgi:hypothetical protein